VGCKGWNFIYILQRDLGAFKKNHCTLALEGTGNKWSQHD